MSLIETGSRVTVDQAPYAGLIGTVLRRIGDFYPQSILIDFDGLTIPVAVPENLVRGCRACADAYAGIDPTIRMLELHPDVLRDYCGIGSLDREHRSLPCGHHADCLGEISQDERKLPVSTGSRVREHDGGHLRSGSKLDGFRESHQPTLSQGVKEYPITLSDPVPPFANSSRTNPAVPIARFVISYDLYPDTVTQGKREKFVIQLPQFDSAMTETHGIVKVDFDFRNPDRVVRDREAYLAAIPNDRHSSNSSLCMAGVEHFTDRFGNCPCSKEIN